MVVMVYLDNCIIAAKKQMNMIEFKANLRKLKYDLTDEGGIKVYLEVNMSKQNNGSLMLTQPQLIKLILKKLNFNRTD